MESEKGGQEHTRVPEIRTVSDDLELQAPAPTVPEISDNEKSEKMDAIVRTDTAQAAGLHLESASEEDRAAAAGSQLQPETHTAIMESVGQPEPQQELAKEMEDQLTGIDSGFPGTAEIARKPVEVSEDGAVHLDPRDSFSEFASSSDNASALAGGAPENQERQQEADDSSHLGPIRAPDDTEREAASCDLEPAAPTSHEESAHINRSGNQLEETPSNDKDAVRDTVPSSERQASIAHDTPVPEDVSPEKSETAETDEQKPQSGIEHYATSDVKDDKEEETSAPAPQEEHTTDKNEHDETLGEPAEYVSAAAFRRVSAIISDAPESKEGSSQEVSQAPRFSLDTVSDVKGEHIDTHLPEERPTTGAVAFHQEKQAEGIPLSYEEGRATTGVASVIKPAIPPRPAKKHVDHKPKPTPESQPIPVPILPQSDGPPPAERSPVLPSDPKPPVPLASKPAIPPRPVRPPRPVKKDPLNGSEGAPLTAVSSASSARSLFEAGGPEAAAAAKAKPKPPVPARPIGNKIAALQGGFFAELNKKLGKGPTAPEKEGPKEEEKEQHKEVKPLADARKGRARGPARRAPAKVEKAKDVSPAAAPAPAALKQEFSFSAPTTVWEVSPEDGDIKLPSGTATPKAEKAEEFVKPETAVEAKHETPKVIEVQPEIFEEALKVTKYETDELENPQEGIKATTPPAVETPQHEPEPAASSWTGTTALGAVAMSAQEVVAETAAKASKTIKDFTEGEEHVLSDVEDQDSASPSDGDFSAPSSPKVAAQNDGPSEAEARAEEVAASENPAEPLSAVTGDVTCAQPSSETSNPRPSISSSPSLATTNPTTIEAQAQLLAAPENAAAAEAALPVPSAIPSAVPPQAFAGHVPAPATAPTSPPTAQQAEPSSLPLMTRLGAAMGWGGSESSSEVEKVTKMEEDGDNRKVRDEETMPDAFAPEEQAGQGLESGEISKQQRDDDAEDKPSARIE